MSLALFRERIEAGEVDETVRAHLRGCEECRAHYDQLQRVARALGDDGAAAERERLMKALPGQRSRRSDWALLAAAALAAGLVTFLLLPKAPADTGLRGGPNDAPAPFSLRVYGKDSPGQPVRLIADFPGAREATVGLRSELQFFVKPGNKTVLVEARGSGRTLVSRSELSSEDLTPVGKAFPVGSFGPGNIEVCVAQASAQHATLEDAQKAGNTKYCSTLVVSP